MDRSLIRPGANVRQRRATAGIAVLVAVAYAYTTPWISHVIRRGAWWYADGAALVRALSIPLGEYLFFAIQTLVVGIALLGGGLCLVALDDSYRYLGGLFAWVGPVLALQWGVDEGCLVRTPGTRLAATLLPAAYSWVVDRIAIGVGTWRISSDLTTGLAVFGLPIEELLFFVAAGLMTVNGLVLFEWALDWNERRIAASSRPTSAAAELESKPTGRDGDGSDPDHVVVDD